MSWNSRRSNALGLKHCVASDNNIASMIGMEVMKNMGGTAADAAIAVSAALNVLQPATCGLGGDAWILYYENETKKVHCICGQGKTPEKFTLENISKLGLDKSVPIHHAICIGIPGAPAAFCDLHEKFGSEKLPLSQLFKPAIELAKGGFPVAEVNSMIWREGLMSLKSEGFQLGSDFLINGQWPKGGQIVHLPNLAKSYEELGQFGKKAIYDGRIAKSIVDCVQNAGGFVSLDDLLAHESEWMEPIFTLYKSKSTEKVYKVWETPMTTQGVVVLEALNLLQSYPSKGFHRPENYYPALVDVLRLGFEDLSKAWQHSNVGCCPDAQMLLSHSQKFAEQKLSALNASLGSKVIPVDPNEIQFGKLGDTTYFCTTDQWGNACSCVFSNYAWFGTGYVPEGCGFTMNNRVRHFWEFMHRKFAPRTRPFGTIIAGMLTEPNNNDFMSAFGVMGGQNQPQGHLQAVLNLTEFGLTPQEAIDKERIRIEFDFDTLKYQAFVEQNQDHVREILRSRGHSVAPPISGYQRNSFGRGRIITKGSWWDTRGQYADSKENSVYWAGSDPRGDGDAQAV